MAKAKVKVNPVAVMYYKYIVETDAPIEVAPIIWRGLIQKLLDATPAYRARHPEKYATPPASNAAGTTESDDHTSSNAGEGAAQSDSGQSNGESEA